MMPEKTKLEENAEKKTERESRIEAYKKCGR
jgi:hypothetical protein